MLSRTEYIESIAEKVQQECEGTGLFPSVQLAQACLESRDGNSWLTTEYHNHFGMKPGSLWHGPVIPMWTNEVIKGQAIKEKTNFRVYDDFEASLKDHIAMMERVPVYRNAGLFSCTTAEKQCEALLRAGYCTDPNYPQKLINIINENNLKQYDPK